MNRKQLNKLQMYSRVHAVLKKKEDRLAIIPALAAGFTAFERLIGTISRYHTVQGEDTTGLTRQRDEAKRRMTKSVLITSGALQSYASDKADRALYQSMSYSYSDLFYITDITARDRALHVANTLAEHIASLADYGLTKSHYTQLKNAIAAFEAVMDDKSVTHEEKQTATQSMEDLFDQADAIVKDKLDKLMLQLEEREAELYHTYLNAREIIDLGGSPSPEEPGTTGSESSG